MDNKNQDWFSKVILNCVKYGMILFIVPVLVVGFGWLGGEVVKWIFGDLVTSSLNIIFGTTRFTKEQLPEILATLALIGGYFHYRVENKPAENKKDKK